MGLFTELNPDQSTNTLNKYKGQCLQMTIFRNGDTGYGPFSLFERRNPNQSTNN